MSAIKRGFFVIGTDTGIGKTVASATLLTALRSFGPPVRYWKPLQTGGDSDTASVARLCAWSPREIFSPAYDLRLAAAPSRAAQAEAKRVDLDEIVARWRGFPAGRWIVEGAGGLLVPLNERQTNRDLVRAVGLPAILVASTRLGTINHLLMTLEAAAHAKVRVAGILLNGPEDPGLEDALRPHLAGVPIIGRLPWLETLDAAGIERSARGVRGFLGACP